MQQIGQKKPWACGDFDAIIWAYVLGILDLVF